MIATLLETSQRVVADTEFQKTMATYGLIPVNEPSGPFRKFLEADANAWERVVKENNISAE